MLEWFSADTLSWMSAIVLIVAYILVGQRKSYGWAINLVGSGGFVATGIWIQNYGISFFNGFMMLVSAFNWWLWSRPKSPEKT